MQKESKGEKYIEKFPYLKKWINECVACKQQGYNPALPDRISTVEGSLDVYFLKKYFKPLQVNKDGLCAVCEKLLRE